MGGYLRLTLFTCAFIRPHFQPIIRLKYTILMIYLRQDVSCIIFIYFDHGDKKVNCGKSTKKTSSVKGRRCSNRCFILAYSSITIEANSTNGFLTIFQMIKELNKEPVICINGSVALNAIVHSVIYAGLRPPLAHSTLNHLTNY